MDENETLEADKALVIATLATVGVPQQAQELLTLVNETHPEISLVRMKDACKALTKQPICKLVRNPITGIGAYTHISLSWDGSGTDEETQMPTMKPQHVFKSSKTGQIVTEKYARANPDTTYRETLFALPKQHKTLTRDELDAIMNLLPEGSDVLLARVKEVYDDTPV